MTTNNVEKQLSEARIELETSSEEDFGEVEQEIWADIEEFPGYQVSNFGQVRNSKKSKNSTGGILKQSDNGKGYLKVDLYRNGNRTTVKTHGLVAKAFVENIDPEVYTQVDHRDRCKTNNRASNLRFVDAFGNQYNRADRMFDIVPHLGPEFVQIRQYGRHVFDGLYYDGCGKFYMYVDEHAGFREIIPRSNRNSYRIWCIDVSGIGRNMGLVKLTNYAIILLTEKYDEIALRRQEIDEITGISPEDED